MTITIHGALFVGGGFSRGITGPSGKLHVVVKQTIYLDEAPPQVMRDIDVYVDECMCWELSGSLAI